MIKISFLCLILAACGNHSIIAGSCPDSSNRAATAIHSLDVDVKCDDWSRGSATDKAYCEASGYLVRCFGGDDGKAQCKQVADLRKVDEPAKPDAGSGSAHP